ncbi:tripartite tricarboxylate transporter substrate binding protein [Rhodoplanes sp. TEM]|uniref:Tripartite tricarboxylate transporter substrate binding protein n=1 Tax=Rhodoplanes tepidamans TaxID=200616 RepID=A0ABT5J966_RHOTP|nr:MULTISPECIES: tripartite tricarboxylate transporter substrate binding protein [Rhodoplanes]MDC7786204.1 tripartite tricarboxylate transporter substrate binding protein [Rhodoplanes tepidamans]MDC7982425.1 tripartite tricarboxylate transporter substrate binding protein [Rhodoplanes sp. TEM]MDQ0355003.1 tripartite-type tricarboxylate transporter receptor subunit TctC [Rhodoplanes tepidamans]
MRKLFAAVAAVLLAGTATAAAQSPAAQPGPPAAWPTRQVTIVVPFTAGGTTDMFARIFANAMQQKTGTPFVVENRAGAGGNIGSTVVARAPKDGYTLLVGTVSTHAINAFVYKSMPHDVEKDFQPVSLFARLPNLLVVNPKLPVKTVAELTDYLKKNPDKLVFGSSGVGASNHLAGELFKIRTGTTMTHVPYRSSNEIMNNLIGGHIDLAFDNMTLAWPQAKSGTVRAIAVTSLERSPVAPDVPTIAETLPGFDATSWHGLFVPAGTPRPVVDRLAAETKAIFSTPEVQKMLADVGAVAAPNTPEAFATFLAAERKKWQEVVKAAGVQQP